MLMSGGVDSSVGAYLLKKQGHRVTGGTMHLIPPEIGTSGCCSLESTEDARRVASLLDIDYHVFNLETDFLHTVYADFRDKYLNGLTPNPCVECNRRLKFQVMLKKAHELGYDSVATGHYCRILDTSGGKRLARSDCREKDQSYAMYFLIEEQLEQILFPVGELTKEEVRSIASEMGMVTADKAESMDLCFVAGDYSDHMSGADLKPGPIVDPDGAEVGRHDGIHLYSVGQRKRLPGGMVEPMFVTEIRPETSTVVIGPREKLAVKTFILENFETPSPMFETQKVYEVMVRYNGPLTKCTAEPIGAGQARVTLLDQLDAAVSPGQFGVLYDGDNVAGGGMIGRERE